MKEKKNYSLNQSALYSCTSKKKLAQVLSIDLNLLNNLDQIITYTNFTTGKKNSTDLRNITAPNPVLKSIQKRFFFLLKHVKRHSWLVSGEIGRSYIDNGKIHSSSNYLLSVDIRSFYDNCTRDRVYLFCKKQLKMSSDVAKLSTDLLTYNGKIPTGCPTSQIIAYYSYVDMFEEINNKAKSYNCIFSLYVDDMTFSSTEIFNHNLLSNEIDIILRKYNHKPKYKKIKFYYFNTAKPVTGTIISNNTIILPNKMHEKIFKNFNSLKKLLSLENNTEEDNLEVKKLTKTLRGQLNSIKTIERHLFPEINKFVFSLDIDNLN